MRKKTYILPRTTLIKVSSVQLCAASVTSVVVEEKQGDETPDIDYGGGGGGSIWDR